MRTPHATAPAVLGIGPPAAPHERVFVLGYPASTGPSAREETWSTLENDRMPRESLSLSSLGETVWIQAPNVRRGHRGGPIFAPRTGQVAGIVRGMIGARRCGGYPGMPQDGVDMAPGSTQPTRLTENAAPGPDVEPASQRRADPLAVARRATVHVVCRH